MLKIQVCHNNGFKNGLLLHDFIGPAKKAMHPQLTLGSVSVQCTTIRHKIRKRYFPTPTPNGSPFYDIPVVNFYGCYYCFWMC